MTVPDRNWRLAQLLVSGLGFLVLIITIAYSAGQLTQRQNAHEEFLRDHVDIECHGQVCIRISVLETQVGTMAASVKELVRSLREEKQSQE